MSADVAMSWLRRRLAPGLVAIALLAVFSAAALTYLSYRRAVTDLVIQQDEQLAHLSATRLVDELSKFSNELTTVARSLAIVGGPEAQRQALDRARNRLVVFDGGVVLMDNFGRVQGAIPERPAILNQDWSDRPFFNRLLATSTPYFSDILSDGPGAAEVVVISVPVVGASGELVGVLAGMFRIGEQTTSSFYASIVRLRLGQEGSTYLMDGDGRVLYDSSYNVVGTALQPRLPYSIGRGRVGALRTRDEVGNDIVAAFAPVPGTDWTLITEDDWSALTAPVRRYARNLLLILAFGLLLPPFGVAALIRQQNTEMADRERAQQEQHVARLIHEMIVPQVPPTLPGWDLAFQHQQAHTGKLDFYDVMFRPDGSLMLALGRVDDSGFRAVHLISSLRAVLRGAALRLLPPDEALACSAELLAPDLDDNTSLAYLYGVLNPDRATLSYAARGFPAPCVAGDPPHAGNGSERLAADSGVDTGDSRAELSIAEGQCVVLFSAGLVNAHNVAGEPFGRNRVQSTLSQATGDAKAVVAALSAALRAFTEGQSDGLTDGVTIVILKRLRQAEFAFEFLPLSDRLLTRAMAPELRSTDDDPGQ